MSCRACLGCMAGLLSRRGCWRSMRTRKNATMLARTMAMTPPAEAPPTSNSQQRAQVDQEGEVGRGEPGPPDVVTKISAKIDSRKIVSIITTTADRRGRDAAG